MLHSVYQSICSLAGKPCWCVHMLWLCFSANMVFLFPGQSPSQWSPIVLYTYCGCVSVLMCCFYFLASHPASEAPLSCTHAVVVFHCWCDVSVSWLVTQPRKLYCHVHMLWLCFNADVCLFPGQSPSQWSPIDMYTHCGVSVLMWCFYFLASHPASETLLSCTHAVVVFQCWCGVSISWPVTQPVNPIVLCTHCGCVSVLTWCFYFLAIHPASEAPLSCTHTVVVCQCWCGVSISWPVTQPVKPHCLVHTLWLYVSADVVFLFPSQSPSQWSPLSCPHAVVVFQCWRGVSISWPVTPVSRTSCTLSSCMNSRLLGIFTLAPFSSSSMACMKKCRWKVLLFTGLGSVFVYPCCGLSGWEETFSYTGCNMDSCGVPLGNILGVNWCMLFYIDKCILLPAWNMDSNAFLTVLYL